MVNSQGQTRYLQRRIEDELLSRERIFALVVVETINGQADTDGDEAIGDVKRRPVIGTPETIEEVDHFAINHPIDEIANGAADNEGQGGAQTFFIVGQPPEHVKYESDGDERHRNQKRPAKHLGAAGKDAEGRAGVAHIGEAEQSVNDRDRMVKRHQAVDDNLSQLIDNDNRHEPAGDDAPFQAQAKAPALSTAAQRAQAVG